LGLASQALNSTSEMADCTDPAIQQLLTSLHPPRKSSVPLPSLPPETPLVVLEDDPQIARILRRCDNGSTSGPSGWSGSMIRVLATSTHCRVALIRLLQDIINDNIPACVQPHILACRLVAINKPGGGGVRPIAVGEMFYRLAAAIAVKRVVPEAINLFSPHQYGVGLSDGCQRVIHSLQHELTSDNRRLVALKVDISNAFNTVDRRLLISSLYNTPELRPIWRIAQFAYNTTSPLLLQGCGGKQIPSSDGVRQGDPLGTLLFCFYIKDLLAAIAEESGAQPYSFVDDIHLLGEPEQVLRALDLLKERLPSLSLQLNPTKSSVAYFHQHSHPLPGSITDSFLTAGVKLVYDYLPVLGAVVGASEFEIIRGLRCLWEEVSSMSPFFRRLSSSHLPVHHSMVLLRMCGVPKMNHLLRSIAPRCMSDMTIEFDVEVQATALSKLDITHDEVPVSLEDNSLRDFATLILSLPLSPLAALA
jgi:hypothetical protein